jgi:hypothetical protein
MVPSQAAMPSGFMGLSQLPGLHCALQGQASPTEAPGAIDAYPPDCSDRRSSSIAALRLKAREHTASVGLLNGAAFGK